MSSKHQLRKERVERERAARRGDLSPHSPRARNRDRKCGACRLCSDLDAPIFIPSVKHGDVELPRPALDHFVGLSFLPPEADGPGCLWAQGLWGRDPGSRPDHTGVVPWLAKQPCRPGDVVLFSSPAKPDAWRRSAIVRKLIAVAVKQERSVRIYHGGARGLVIHGRTKQPKGGRQWKR